MIRLSALLALIALLPVVQAQTQPSLAEALGFEAPPVDTCPGGWMCGVPGTIAADSQVFHGGKSSVRIERNAESAQQFSTVTKSIPMDFRGGALELRGFIRTEDVQDFVAFWIRQDGPNGPVGFASMQGRQVVKGTTPWTSYSISLLVNPEARALFFGFLLSGQGKGWADDLQLLLDGKPVWEAPKVERPKTVLDTDHEFDGGSAVTLTSLNPVQIQNLTTLGKVWGFLKYHHPRVVAGTHHFDYDLFRVLPQIVAAPDRRTANEAMLRWIDGLGAVTPCTECATLDESKLHFRPDIGWISDEAMLGPDLSRALQKIHKTRPAGARQFYVSLIRGVSNPMFENEAGYNRIPDAGIQILALYRYWNMVEYWYPYRDLIGDSNWDAILPEFLPRIALAKDRESYLREMLSLVARVQDSHATISAAAYLQPPIGACRVPVDVRFVEGQPIVATYSNAELGRATGLKPGDVIEELDGVAVSERIRQWIPLYTGSNETARIRDIGRSMTRGDCAKPLALRIRRGGETLDLNVARAAASQLDPRTGATHDRSGDAFQLLSPDIAYLKLSKVKAADAPTYVKSAAKTKGLIIDIRNYPSEFMVFALGQLLVDRPTEFARFTAGDLSNPGAFHWGDAVTLQPKQPHYSGRIVILVDETSISQAEYTTMAFRSVSGATVIGSTTAAADGNVSPITLPGGIGTQITGLGVFYPDKKPTQRIGMIPDKEVKPTIAGIRDGRDEVLEAAVRQVLGPEPPDDVVRKLAAGK